VDSKDKCPPAYDEALIPVSFRCLEIGSDSIEYATQIESISRDGFLMTSPKRLKVGSRLSLRLRVPPEISGSPFWETRCTGHVTAQQRLKDGRPAYRVEIETAFPI
jgi:hypothetical protein